MKLRLLFASTLAILSLSCARSVERSASEPSFSAPSIEVEQDEVEVARKALLERSWSRPPSIGPGLVVVDRLQWRCASTNTTLDELARMLRNNSRDDVQLAEAVEDFLQKAEDNVASELLVGEIQGLELIPASTIDALGKATKGGKGDFWDHFGAAYPRSDGYRQLSRVGLSVDRRLAVIAISSHQGWWAGSGKIEVYELVEGRWTPSFKDLRVRWIS